MAPRRMFSTFALAGLALLGGPLPAGAQDAEPCEKRWTFPVPFYQSVAWSPDGSSIAAAATEFDRDCKDHHSLILVAPDGAGRRQLLPAG